MRGHMAGTIALHMSYLVCVSVFYLVSWLKRGIPFSLINGVSVARLVFLCLNSRTYFRVFNHMEFLVM